MYRPVDIEFWQDEFILELSSEQKLTYIFLLTNRRTTQCGIYNIGLTIAQLELQFSEEKIMNHLKFFQEKGKLFYNHKNKEVMLLNWYKYNNTHNHKNIRICINKELKRIKTTEFISTFYEICKGICREEPEFLEEIFKDVEVPDELLEREREMQREAKETKEAKEVKEEAATGEFVKANQEGGHKGSNKEDGKENNGENHKENSEEISKENIDKPQNKNVVLQCFKNNFHLPSPIEIQKLNQWVEDMGEALVLKALEEAVGVNKRNLNYVSGILNNWLSEGITTLKEAEEAIKRYKELKKAAIGKKEDNSGTRFYSKNLAEVDYEKE
ncbi:DnaD domain-containing protein [Clostridium tunisiense]|uniref:DnaD domain-containing protein n=1 Tax=Clostridium tunisiense TaxID=219748 RepID=UPI0002DF2453|nr:DnaD domain protein [Clostridium tunisiense]